MPSLTSTLQGRVFSITEIGWMGIFPKVAATGDPIPIFHGYGTLFVIRLVGSKPSEVYQTFRFIRECYIYGIMDGKYLGDLSDRQVERFILV